MSKKFKIVAIDGGGMRGIIPGTVIMHLERALQDATKDKDVRISDYVDLFAGTSTGGILASLYMCPNLKTGRPKYSAQEAVNLYIERGKEIFSKTFWSTVKSAGGLAGERYAKDAIEEILNDLFGKIKLSEMLTDCVIPSYDIKRRKAFFFKRRKALENPGRDFYMKDVARATSSAPLYFEPALITSLMNVTYPLIDGGIFANNPALCAYVEAADILDSPSPDNIGLLSFGTGNNPLPYEIEEAKHWGALGWSQPLVDMVFSSSAEVVAYQLEGIFDINKLEEQYIRVNPVLTKLLTPIDNTNEENVAKLQEIGNELYVEHREVFNRLVQFLIKEQTPKLKKQVVLKK